MLADDACEKTLPPAISKSNSCKTPEDVTSMQECSLFQPRVGFRVLAKARKSGHLSFLEAVFFSRLSPVLCAQTEFVVVQLCFSE